MNAATPLLQLVLAALAVAAGARSLWLRGALDGIAAWWRGASRTARAEALALLVAAFACGTDKTPGDGLRALPRGAFGVVFQFAGRIGGCVLGPWRLCRERGQLL